MSKNLQYFVNNFLAGMQVGNTVVNQTLDRRERADYRRQQLALATQKAKDDAKYRADKMGIETRRVGAYEKGVEGKYIKDTRAPVGKAGPAAPTPEMQKWRGDNPGGDTPPDAVGPGTSVTVEPPDTTDTIGSAPASYESDAHGGRVGGQRMARGGRAFGGAMRTGMAMGNMVNRMRGRDQWGRPINPDPTQAPGSSGPGSGYGAIATRPPASLSPPSSPTDAGTFAPSGAAPNPADMLSGTGGLFRRGGAVRRFADGGSADETRVPPYERPYWSRDAYPWQGPDPATGRPADLVYDRPYPTDRPPMNRDQSPDRYYAGDPGYPGREAVRDFERRGPVSEDVPVRQSEFPYVYPKSTYTGPLAPEHEETQVYPELNPRGEGVRPLLLNPLADRPPEFSPRELGVSGNDSPDEHYRNDTRPGANRPMPSGASSPKEPYEFGPSPAQDRTRRPGTPTTAYDPSDYEGSRRTGSPDQKTDLDERSRGVTGDEGRGRPQTMPPVVVRGGAGGDRLGGAGARGGSGRGAIDTGWKRLRDQTRTAAYDPQADLLDPENVHAVDPRTGATKAALAGAASYADHVFGQGQVQGQSTGGEGAPMDQRKMQGKAAMLGGAGAADPALMQQIFQKVDPGGRMPMGQRMQAAITEVHKFYSDKGDTLNADKSAMEVAQFANKMAQEHGKAALQAIQKGDMQGAVGLLVQGYNTLPDGITASLDGNNVVLRDDSGRVTQTYPMDQRAIHNIALGMTSGELGWDVIRMGAKMDNRPAQAGGAPPGPAARPPAAAPQGAAQPAAAPAGPSAQPPAAASPARSAGPPAGAPAPEAGSTGSPTAVGRPTTAPNVVPQSRPPPSQGAPTAPEAGTNGSPTAVPRPPTAPNRVAQAPAGPSQSPPAGASSPPSGGQPGRPVATPPASPNAVPAKPVSTVAPPAGGTTPTPGVPEQGDAPSGRVTDQGIQAKPPKRLTPVETMSPKQAEQDRLNKDPYGAPPGTTYEEPSVLDMGQVAKVKEQIARAQKAHEQDLIRTQQTAPPGIKQSEVSAKVNHKIKVFNEQKKEMTDALKLLETRQHEQNKAEKADLKPREVPETNEETKQTAIETRMNNIANEASRSWRDAGPEKRAADRAAQAHANSPLRYAVDPNDPVRGELSHVATEIWRHNKGFNNNKSVDAAVTMASIMKPQKGQPEPRGVNRQAGDKATTFVRLADDPRGNVLVQLGNDRVHMPKDTYDKILAVRRINWQKHLEEKAEEDAAAKRGANASEGVKTLVDNLKWLAPTGGRATSGR